MKQGIDLSNVSGYKNDNDTDIIFYREMVEKLKKKQKEKGLGRACCNISMREYLKMIVKDRRIYEQTIFYEKRVSARKLSVCSICKSCRMAKMTHTKNGLKLGYEDKRIQVCDSCFRDGTKFTTTNKVIPYWVDIDGTIQTKQPKELKNLTLAEKGLIALASPHMTLVHLKNGTLGSRGHVCSVEQRTCEIAYTLPRLPKDVNIVRVARSGRKANQEHELKVFKVRRFVVMAALTWLVKFNCQYRDLNVCIDEGNLNWMDGADSSLLPVRYSAESNNDCAEDSDLGPAPDQTLAHILDADEELDFEASGMLLLFFFHRLQ
jgi:hypothetical protein